ncbi:calcyphosin-2-like [Physella acuta]|uniref:calcyphosin-2-like n=1 Tax=Physella acuta TaxID=109671 RepID=UPI0027DCEE3D|nr:calcyphosin-2-like [Physella acuta]
MDFSVQGMATPRSNARHLPGSARGRPQINPITGEEMHVTTPRLQSKPVAETDTNVVPSLDLKYLKDDLVKTGALDIDLRIDDYSLETPNSASTVSWGTGRSSYRPRPVQQVTKNNTTTVRPQGVPGLDLSVSRPASAKKQGPKQPTAWDKEAVPLDIPPPSSRHKELYQQYADEMKQSYRAHANPSQKKVETTSEQVYSSRETEKLRDKNFIADEEEEDENRMNDNWTKERYSGKQLIKKKDIEDLLEHNKKQKLVETVMIDQLSRAVISDPEQNVMHTSRPSSSRRGRGTNRYLHDTKISTASTATENLLSKRVRFGARILTRDGHNAMRELTGFFFDFDKTLTVYEFWQFGKSAKAMPFIYRGQYFHKSGPKSGLPYSLSDIYTGANLKIPTEGQLALTDSLAKNKFIVLRITEVDEQERQQLLAEHADESERLHAPSKLDVENREFLYMIQDMVQQKLAKRGVKTITGLGRFYRKLDQYNTGILDQYDLEKGIKMFRLDLDPDKLEEVFDILDPEGNKLLDYGDYMHGVIGEMNEYRKALVRKAFGKLDSGKKGAIHISDVNKFFNVNSTYKTDGDTSVSALQSFLEAVRDNEKQELISYIEFEEYYEGLSVAIDKDEDFANVLRNTWNI